MSFSGVGEHGKTSRQSYGQKKRFLACPPFEDRGTGHYESLWPGGANQVKGNDTTVAELREELKIVRFREKNL